MASIHEQNFILKLMEFIYQLSDKPLQHCLQELLDEFRLEIGSYFTNNIEEVVLEFVMEFNYTNLNLVDLSSPAYPEKIKEILKCASHLDFLKILTHYCLKSRIEYYNDKLLDSSTKFYSSILSVLEEMKKNHRCDAKFWEELDLAAALKLELKNRESSDSQNYESLTFNMKSEEDMKSEEEFILVAMKVIYNFYRKQFPDCLQRKHDAFMLKSTTDFDPKVDAALVKLLEDLDNKGRTIYLYFEKLNIDKRFSEKHFLELCARCTRSVVFKDYPMTAYKILFDVLHSAKQKGKFTSVEYLNGAANEILQDYARVEESKFALSDESTTAPSASFQSAAENVITSSNSTQTAGESENLASVHDHGNECTCNECFKDSCKCC